MSAAHGATGKPARSRNDFSAMRSWAIATALTGGATTTSQGEPLQRLRRGVLELGGDDRAAAGELVEGSGIVVGGDEVDVGDRSGGGGGVGIEDDGAVAGEAGGDDGVAAELATSEHPDRRRRERSGHG